MTKEEKSKQAEEKNANQILALEAEMGRYYNQIDACQSTVRQIQPKLNEVILKIQKLRVEKQ